MYDGTKRALIISVTKVIVTLHPMLCTTTQQGCGMLLILYSTDGNTTQQKQKMLSIMFLMSFEKQSE